MTQATCSLIVPVYNEANRLKRNLPTYLKIKNINQVIIVDDGSTDGCTQFIPTQYPDVSLITYPKNKGKTDAVRAALQKVTASHILLIDADLKNLKPEEVNRGLTYALTHTSIDMVIFIRRAPGNVASVYSGERVIRTNILREALHQYTHAKNFQIEAALNQYCIDTHKSVYWHAIHASNTFHIEKRSPLWFLSALMTIREIIGLIGWKNYYKQITSLTARNREIL